MLRNGYIWFNEIDHRTHREEMWEHTQIFHPYTDPAITEAMLFRDSAADILRGYGDWWMDLFGRGWFRDAATWAVRRKLNRLEAALRDRQAPYRPQIAAVVHEPSMLQDGWGAERWKVLSRGGFAQCGADYGQYLLADILREAPESVKLVYLVACDRLDEATREQLTAFKRAHPEVVFVEAPTVEDLQSAAIAARARTAGVHCFAAPGLANVCSAEGLLAVQALTEGPLELDFGVNGEIADFFTGEVVGRGPRLTLPFKAGENRVFKFPK